MYMLESPVNPLVVDAPMWQHYCPQEQTRLSVGHNEPCNWCGATEKPEQK